MIDLLTFFSTLQAGWVGNWASFFWTEVKVCFFLFFLYSVDGEAKVESSRIDTCIPEEEEVVMIGSGAEDVDVDVRMAVI